MHIPCYVTNNCSYFLTFKDYFQTLQIKFCKMCGIFGLCQYVIQNGQRVELPAKKWVPLADVYISSGFVAKTSKLLINSITSRLMNHRGPDMRNFYQHPRHGSYLFHERLAIMDLCCFQPIEGSSPTRQVGQNWCFIQKFNK